MLNFFKESVLCLISSESQRNAAESSNSISSLYQIDDLVQTYCYLSLCVALGNVASLKNGIIHRRQNWMCLDWFDLVEFSELLKIVSSKSFPTKLWYPTNPTKLCLYFVVFYG